eukprot:m.12760 g.12760  ORF g.12760 m.12760 type:complete len:181 (+) comp9428_c0_seq1:127-669(+)
MEVVIDAVQDCVAVVKDKEDADENDEGHQLLALLGCKESSVELHQFLTKVSGSIITPPSPTDSKTFSSTKYSNYKTLGVSLAFENGLLDCIHLYNTNVDGYTGYTGPCPYKLRMDKTGVDIITLLGEPSKKGGGEYRTNTWVAYCQLGIQINFDAINWESPETSVESMAIYPKMMSEPVQ